MATYNGQRYLAQQLDSIANQARLPDELIVGDDGSSDATLQNLNQFKSLATFPVTIITHKRVGVAQNFLLAAAAATGDFIVFADQDDVWLPAKLQRSLMALHHYQADLVLHGIQPVDEQLQKLRTGKLNVRTPLIEEKLRGNIWLQGGGNTMLFRSSLLADVPWRQLPISQWPDHPFTHDNLIKLLACIRGRTVRLPDRLVLYRQHADHVAGAPPTLVGGLRRYGGRSSHIASLELRAQAAREWSDYFTPLASPADRSNTETYFRNAADAMSARAQRLARAPWSAIPLTISAIARGDFSARNTKGFGWRALLQDLYSLRQR